MAKNLIELIKASGGAGASGQSFRTNVLGTEDGVRMTDYLISDVVWSGDTPSSSGTYASTYTFNTVATITRGTYAYWIQRKTSSAFTMNLSDLGGGGAGGSSATIQTFSNIADGAEFNLGIRVVSNLSGAVSVATFNQIIQEDPYLIIQFYVSVGTVGGSGGTSSFQLVVDYDPDTAAFNPLISNPGWTFTMNNRNYSASDLEFRWWFDSAEAAANNAGTVDGIGPTVDFQFYPDPDPDLEEDSVQVVAYMRWRLNQVGTTWSDVVTSTWYGGPL